MVGSNGSRVGISRRMVLGSALFTCVVLGLVILVGVHSPGLARGTSEEVGVYASDTPLATATLAPSSTPIATPSPTIAATSTGTTTPIATSTAAPTATRTATPTVTSTPLPLHVQLGASAVAQGQTQTALVHTAPKARIAYNVRFAGSAFHLSGTGTADKMGLLAISFKVVPGPRTAAAPLIGTVLVQVVAPGAPQEATVTFKVFPPLHLVTQVHITKVKGNTTLVVQVQLAARAAVTVSATLPGAHTPVATARGTAAARQPLILKLAFGKLRGHVVATVTVKIITINGVREVRSLQVPAHT